MGMTPHTIQRILTLVTNCVRRSRPVTRTRGLISGTYRIVALAAALLVASTLGGSAAAQSVTSAIAGAVSVPAPDGQPFVVPGVTLTLTCGGSEPRIEVSNERGEFRFADVATGVCTFRSIRFT